MVNPQPMQTNLRADAFARWRKEWAPQFSAGPGRPVLRAHVSEALSAEQARVQSLTARQLSIGELLSSELVPRLFLWDARTRCIVPQFSRAIRASRQHRASWYQT